MTFEERDILADEKGTEFKTTAEEDEILKYRIRSEKDEFVRN